MLHNCSFWTRMTGEEAIIKSVLACEPVLCPPSCQYVPAKSEMEEPLYKLQVLTWSLHRAEDFPFPCAPQAPSIRKCVSHMAPIPEIMGMYLHSCSWIEGVKKVGYVQLVGQLIYLICCWSLHEQIQVHLDFRTRQQTCQNNLLIFAHKGIARAHEIRVMQGFRHILLQAGD